MEGLLLGLFWVLCGLAVLEHHRDPSLEIVPVKRIRDRVIRMYLTVESRRK